MSLIVAGLFVLGSVGVGFGQSTTAPAAPAAPAAEKKADKAEKMDKTEKKMEKKMAAKTAVGRVKSASADTLTVAGKSKGKEAEWTFSLDASTKIRKGGKEAAASDLKDGDSVQVRYMEHDGKNVAQTVMARAAMAKKAEAKPAEKK